MRVLVPTRFFYCKPANLKNSPLPKHGQGRPPAATVKPSADSPIKLSYDRLLALFSPRSFSWLLVMAVLIVSVPLVSLALSAVFADVKAWQYIGPRWLDLLLNSLNLALGVAVLSGFLGVGLAWLAVVCEFPGRDFFSWALMLPMAMPAYVLAIVVLGLAEPQGLLAVFSEGAPVWAALLHSKTGIVLTLSLSLYPYVYFQAAQAFGQQSGCSLEIARSLGVGPFRAFGRVAVPMAWPWIATGLAMVAMEALADFGVVYLFDFDTLTTSIYKTWFMPGLESCASQLAVVLALPAMALLVYRHRQMARRAFFLRKPAVRSLELSPLPAICASLCAAAVLGLAFFLPVVQLVLWGVQISFNALDDSFVEHLAQSLLMALAAASAIMAAVWGGALARRFRPSHSFDGLAFLAGTGYALPGLVLATGLAVSAAGLDSLLAAAVKTHLDLDLPPLLRGAVGLLFIAYFLRFLGLGADLSRWASRTVPTSLEETAKELGVNGMELALKVHLPLMGKGLAGAFFVVFVELMRELPMTLLMTPASWSNLAVKSLQMGADKDWPVAALHALPLVAAGTLVVVALARGRGASHA